MILTLEVKGSKKFDKVVISQYDYDSDPLLVFHWHEEGTESFKVNAKELGEFIIEYMTEDPDLLELMAADWRHRDYMNRAARFC